MLRTTPVLLAFFALAAVAIPASAQMGGGGGAGTGIPLNTGGHNDDKDKTDKKSVTEGPVIGVVTDSDGTPVSGAVVELKNSQTQKVVSVITRDKGEYQFSGLSKDIDYQLTATLKDHSSAPHTLSMYDPRPKPVVNLQIK